MQTNHIPTVDEYLNEVHPLDDHTLTCCLAGANAVASGRPQPFDSDPVRVDEAHRIATACHIEIERRKSLN